jgi:uncharacterized protein (TIGR02452 family)
MNPKNNFRQIAEDTLEILKKGHFTAPSGNLVAIAEKQAMAVDNTIVYSPVSGDLLLENRVVAQSGTLSIEVTRESTLEATKRLINEGFEDVVCLNFASAKNPGGGFLGGAQAQEESIARSTGLYPCQLKAVEYYTVNRNTKSCFYTDYMIYSPNVPIIKDDEGNTLDKLMTTAIITAPAVNTGVVKHRESHRIGEIEAVMKRRIAKVLAIALAHGHKTIVLGAWGCGVFQNDPNELAQYFKYVIEGQFKYDFNKIVFAVYSRNERFIQPFIELFNQ